jgi:hypothetical protein
MAPLGGGLIVVPAVAGSNPVCHPSDGGQDGIRSAIELS